MDILGKIIQHKKIEIAESKKLYPVALLEKSIFFQSDCVSLKRYLLREDKYGIIAEIKRKSPSKGLLNPYVDIERTSIGYMQAGASALSVLTDKNFFGGKNEDLIQARKFNFCPILRKDFIIDEYQILEAKSIGADVILLLANVLNKEEVKRLAAFAKNLGMEVFLEIREKEEFEVLCSSIDLVGINNRNLKDFSVDINHSFEWVKNIPDEFVKISESGISKPETVIELGKAGFRGFLIGEHFMKRSKPEKACTDFIRELKKIKTEQK